MKNNILKQIGFVSLTLVGSAVHGSDFGPLMNVVHTTWPEKTHIGVVADYGRSMEEIQALAYAAGEGSTLTVVNLKDHSRLDQASCVLINQVKPDYLVILPHDTQVGDGSFSATVMIRRAGVRAIPTIATNYKAINQGAVFAIGEGTNFELLVNNKLIGSVEVILPQKITRVSYGAFPEHRAAAVTVIGCP